MSDSSGRSFELSPKRRALLDSLVRERAGGPFKPARPAGGDRNQARPLSFAQRRLWFLEKFQPDSHAYHIAQAYSIRGRLDAEALGAALEGIIRRHEALRTNIILVDGEPMQVPGGPDEYRLPIVDLTELPEPDREGLLLEVFEREAAKAFDFGRDLMLRATLVRLGSEEHVLVLVLHHIASDGWSIAILRRELGWRYGELTRGGKAAFPPLAKQYGDYSDWQRHRLAERNVEGDLEYWRGKLSGDLPVLELPLDHARPPVQTFRGGHECLDLEPDFCERLTNLSRTEGTTLFMTLLAAFGIFLGRYTGQEDVIVGTPVAGRRASEWEGLIGLFVNTLAMRLNLSGGPSFREFLSRVRAMTLQAYDHQDVPFERLVEELRPERSLSRTPVFQVMFTVENVPEGPLVLPGLDVRLLDLQRPVARFDLTCYITGGRDGLRARIEYNADLFEATSVRRMLRHYRALLEAAVAAPEQPITALAMLTAEERYRLLEEWNQTAAEYPRDRCVHELFELQAAETPDAIAVEQGDLRLTYGELNIKANRLAHYLRRRGVCPETPVGLWAERSPDTIVGMLGILKSGGAYVPLDPGDPRERLDGLIRDVGVKFLVGRRRPEEISLAEGLDIVRVDELHGESETGNPSARAGPENLAYIMFTSGTTGRPKGVEIVHRGIVRLLFGSDFARLDANGVLLQLSPIAFDASTFEIWGALLHGGRCVLFPNEIPSARGLGRVIREYGVNTLWLTASLFNSVIDEGPEALAPIRQLLTGGEALSPRHVRRAQERLPDTELVNGYGPTECTTFACCYRIPRPFAERATNVPIGRPIANTQVCILDRLLQPVPSGVAGELCLSGDGLARGYRDRPELTAERFIPDPFRGDPAARLYRTGDVARYLPDGTIELLGRLDDQVKIRGFRVEPGEIEGVLREHDGVRDAVVVVFGSGPGDKRLAAYVSSNRTPAPSGVELRGFLERKLPHFMIPAAFVVLDSLPLTPNGKLDRRALPPLGGERPDIGQAFVAPRTETEAAIARIWAELLGVSDVGVRDNFFDLGGHSLMATLLIHRINTTFHSEFPFRRLYEDPTVAGMAKWIDSGATPVRAGNVSPIVRVVRGHGLPLSFPQQRLWFLDQLEGGRPIYNITSAHRLEGPLDVTTLERSFNDLIERHESLRTVFRATGGVPEQVVIPALPFHIHLEDLQQVPECERAIRAHEMALVESTRVFSLAEGPLLRVSVLRLGHNDHILVLVIHHIVSDGWSMGVIFRELSLFYRSHATAEGRPTLPDLPVEYADFACWQRQVFGGQELERHLSYWKEHLEGAPRVLELPADYARPAVQTFAGARKLDSLSETLSDSLRDLSRQEGATLFMTMLAAFQVLLYRYTGHDDIVVGVPIAGRNRTEIEGLIGFFVNTLAIRARLPAGSTFREIVRRAREDSLEALAHQDVPFEKLVEELRPERDLSRNPLVQVLFNFHTFMTRPFELWGLRASPVDLETRVARFDLTLGVRDSGGALRLRFDYSTALFNPATIERMAGHFQNLLEAAVASPDRPVEELPILTAAEREQVTLEWNNTAAPFSSDRCLHELFEDQAARTPDAVAVVFEGHRLTFRELDIRADHLARRLRRAGVGPDVLVGLCLERSLEMVVGVLGILKSGGAYVPIDPVYPLERIAFILEDTETPVVITRREHVERIPHGRAAVLSLDEEPPDEAALPGDAVNGVRPENLAYVIYTSGSTGKPKGVLVEHRSVVNYVEGILNRLEMRSVATYAMVQPLTVDSSVSVLYPPLFTGGCLHVISRACSLDPDELCRYFEQTPIDCLKIAPSHLSALLGGAMPERVLPQRLLIIGGEASRRDWAEMVQSLAPQCRVFNHYGPTETTVGVTTYRLEPDGETHRSSPMLPIGQPLPNVRAYVLDAHGQPLPIGVPGELYLGGECVARGYLHQPATTANAFVPDPFSSVSGARMYRSGDYVRFRPNGDIEFLGRRDEQMKVRGFRVEMGEVEAALEKHPAVREAVAAAREDRLVAYVTLRDGSDFSADDLRRFLREKLPDSMIPSAFVRLAALPRTPHGKLDRSALPPPAESQQEVRTSHVAPRNPLERSLLEIWRRVLGAENAGITDDFFELGGHSLLAVSLFGEIRKVLGRSLPVALLFRAPTVGQLAALLADERWSPRWSSLVALQPGGSRPPFYLVHANTGNVFFYRELARDLGADQPVYALQSAGLDGRSKPLASVAEMAARYLAEIRSLQPHGPYYLGGYCLGAYVALEMASQIHAMNEEVGLLAVMNTDGQWRMARTVIEDMQFHLSRMAQLRPAERPGYVVRRSRYRLFRITGRFRDALARVLLVRGRTLSADAQARHVEELNRRANSRYAPRRFQGDLTYFQGAGDEHHDPRPFWNTVIAGSIEVHRVPGAGIGIFEPPNAACLAEKLRECLESKHA